MPAALFTLLCIPLATITYAGMAAVTAEIMPRAVPLCLCGLSSKTEARGGQVYASSMPASQAMEGRSAMVMDHMKTSRLCGNINRRTMDVLCNIDRRCVCRRVQAIDCPSSPNAASDRYQEPHHGLLKRLCLPFHIIAVATCQYPASCQSYLGSLHKTWYMVPELASTPKQSGERPMTILRDLMKYMTTRKV